MGEGGGMDATLDVMRILEEYGRWKTEIFQRLWGWITWARLKEGILL
jgi:hypothetical protein